MTLPRTKYTSPASSRNTHPQTKENKRSFNLNSEIRFDRQAFYLVVEIRWRQRYPTSSKLRIAKRRCCRAKGFWFANDPSFVTDEQPTAVRRGPEWLRK